MTDLGFSTAFETLTGFAPFRWQQRLYDKLVEPADAWPTVVDIPTGLGKTSVIAIWLLALLNHPGKKPRRLVYVVNRRTVVDQTTAEVQRLRENLPKLDPKFAELAVSTLRGQFADNHEWSADPSKPAVICGTVDMIGSRLLFSGYRIGFKSRPLHAGFLGQDAILIHDEAHLEPAFQQLIETIQKEQQREAEHVGDLPWPRLRVMALSATTRKHDGDQPNESAAVVFRLAAEDEQQCVVKDRFGATKKLVLTEVEDKQLVGKIVECAEMHKDSRKSVLVFARKVEDVEEIVKKLPKDRTEQLTGTLRGLERDCLVRTPVFQRFLPESDRVESGELVEGTVYLVCTSAGEVGVNISADHMVCDLSTFDSMVQRFGRVNRFGKCDDTEIHIIHPMAFGKKDKGGKLTVSEVDIRREKTLELLKGLDGDASPLALSKLDPVACSAAFAPEPVILPATDILFDAWSMTTIREKMPGRPPVEPYLHGVTDWEPPQTQIAWREEVGVITKDLLERYRPQDLLDDFPLKPHELLRDRTDRIFTKLQALAASAGDAPVWIIESDGAVAPTTLGKIADPTATAKNKMKKPLEQAIANTTILLPPSVGGLCDGLFDGQSPSADDVAASWNYEDKAQTVQRRARSWDNASPPEGMVLIRTIDTKPDADEFDSPDHEDEEPNSRAEGRFWYWYCRRLNAEDTSRASTRAITLEHHTRDVVERTRGIVEALELPENLSGAIILAAELHDLGKKRKIWQHSIGNQLPENPMPDDWLAKPGSRGKPGLRTDYRHEFGSLLDVLDPSQEHLARFGQLDSTMQDLVLHLIAAHHGRARPHFPQANIWDPRPGSGPRAMEQAMQTPRRFARLQRKYGRWGLAYIESLLRAADWAASAEPSPIKEGNS